MNAVDVATPRRKRFERYRIRYMGTRDVPLLLQWFEDPMAAHALDDEQVTPVEREAWLTDLAESSALADNQAGFILERDGKPCGFTVIMWINWLSRTCEFDTLAPPEHRGGFVGVALVVSACHIAFNWLNLERIYGFVYEDILNAGTPMSTMATIEARMRGAAVRNGTIRDVYVLSGNRAQLQHYADRFGVPRGPTDA